MPLIMNYKNIGVSVPVYLLAKLKALG